MKCACVFVSHRPDRTPCYINTRLQNLYIGKHTKGQDRVIWADALCLDTLLFLCPDVQNKLRQGTKKVVQCPDKTAVARTAKWLRVSGKAQPRVFLLPSEKEEEALHFVLVSNKLQGSIPQKDKRISWSLGIVWWAVPCWQGTKGRRRWRSARREELKQNKPHFNKDTRTNTNLKWPCQERRRSMPKDFFGHDF